VIEGTNLAEQANDRRNRAECLSALTLLYAQLGTDMVQTRNIPLRGFCSAISGANGAETSQEAQRVSGSLQKRGSW